MSQLKQPEKDAVIFFLVGRAPPEIVLEVFKKAGSSPDIKDYTGTSLICHAISQKCFSLADYLVQQNARLDGTDLEKNTPLHLALQINDRQLITQIAKKVDVKTMNAVNTNDWSPLVYALANKDPRFFSLLVECGARVNDLSPKGHSLLANFIAWRNTYAVDLLLEKGANPNIGDPSPILAAIIQNDLDTVKKLEQEVYLFYEDNAGKVPFIEAILRGSTEMVKWFIGLPKCRINTMDARGINPLLAALFVDNPQKIQAIKGAGGKLPTVWYDKAWEIAEHIMPRLPPIADRKEFRDLVIAAIQKGSLETVEWLIRLPQCQINMSNEEGITPLLAALFVNDPQKVQAIKNAGGKLPIEWSDKAWQIVTPIVQKLAQTGSYEDLTTFIKENPTLISLVIDDLDDRPDIILNWLKTDVLSPNFDLPFNRTVFSWILYYRKSTRGIEDLIKTCLQKGANLEFHTLANVIRQGNITVIQLLLVDPRIDPSYGNNYPLNVAISERKFEAIKLLLDDPRVDPCAFGCSAIKEVAGKREAAQVMFHHPKVVANMAKVRQELLDAKYILEEDKNGNIINIKAPVSYYPSSDSDSSDDE
ncbi:MAG: ankyrin repeat domain-containing protein [Verrucomicrobia bacterium]|nr:ankyrin repeat domain-containing protein [Verrucomicrobiota bacterium]